MGRRLSYVLVSDGSSDACLLSHIEWLLRDNGWRDVKGHWADLGQVPDVGRALANRLRVALELYAVDIVFVHRDAETEALATRIDEIAAAAAGMGRSVPHVCVVPVRMTEAWLLHDEAAIRRAVDNPNGRAKLPIPPVKRLEEVADPKSVLREALLVASESSGGRRRKMRRDFGQLRRRVAERITDYAPLRVLEAFARFEHDLRRVLDERNTWGPPGVGGP
jgi:hypothetical protein